MPFVCDSIDSFFGIDSTAPSADQFTDETSTCWRRKLRGGVWSSDDVAWAEGLVRRFNHITTPLLRTGAEVEGNGSATNAKEQPARIPKTIHFIWLGSKPIPRHYKSEIGDNDTADAGKDAHMQDTKGWNLCMRSWLDHHPPSTGWTIRLWTEKEVKVTFLGDESEYTMANRDAYEYALSKQNYGLASDTLRLEILSAFGGVYADIDYLCTAPFDDLHSAAEFYCGASNVGCIEINNGLMGSAARHGAVERMISEIRNWFNVSIGREEPEAEPAIAASAFLSSFLDAETAQSLTKAKELSHEDVIRHTGPGLITKIMMEMLVESANDGGSENSKGIDRIFVLPAQYFHSLPNISRANVSDFEDVDEYYKRNGCDDTTRAVHLWGCSWQKAMMC